jgi:hypothetical protein
MTVKGGQIITILNPYFLKEILENFDCLFLLQRILDVDKCSSLFLLSGRLRKDNLFIMNDNIRKLTGISIIKSFIRQSINLDFINGIRCINNSAATIPKNILLPNYLDDKLSKVNKDDLLPEIKKGFINYQVLFSISNITSTNIFNYLDNFQQFIDGLEDNKIYTILCNAVSDESKETSSLLPRSLFIHRKSSAKQFVYILHSLLLNYEFKYQYDLSSNLIISGRIWYSVDDINELNKDKYNKVEDRVNHIMKDYLINDKSLQSIFKPIEKYYKSINIKLHPMIIEKLTVIIGSDGYSLYDTNKFLSDSKLLVFYHENERECYLLDNSLVLSSWIDKRQGSDVEREFENLMILFKKDGSYDINVKYKFDSLVESGMSAFYNDKIGCIDFETYSVNDEGKQRVYAGGWICNNEVHKFILGDPGCETSYFLVEQVFNSILSSKYTDYTFYIHNLSKFDSIFILDALTRFNYNVKAIVKEDNSIVSISISKSVSNESQSDIEVKGGFNNNKRSRKSKINVLDSNLMIKGSLRNLCKHFDCLVQKGYFPYRFVSSNTLDYVGEIPSIKYFDCLSLDKYNELSVGFKDKDWSVKMETGKYLELDLRSLHEVLLKFSNIVYNNYGINITDFKTISSLSLHIYLSNFYNIKYDIKLIKGRIEKQIREAYYGGLVHLNCNKIDKGYYYDMNSQYPSAMLNDMPVGDPILSTDTNLNSYFGFCYAKIIPPKNLDILLIPHKNDKGEIYLPSEPFTGLYFSELLKNSLNYGYKVEVIGGFQFKRGVAIFNEFVNNIYEERVKAKLEGNNSLQLVDKLILNSLYGRMGMKNIENKTEIISKEKAEYLFKNKNILFVSELNDKLIVKYNKNIDSEIVKLINDFNSSNPQSKEMPNVNKIRGVTSSVAIAAAITAYAQISMMKFKNIPNNKCLYSDTDSAVLENPLSPSFVDSNKLGMMKLEHVITEGYFISKKVYGFKNSIGETIIKSKGIEKGVLDLDKFILLSKGEDITVQTTVFMKNFREGTVNIINRPYTIKGSQLSNLNQKDLISSNNLNLSLIPYKFPDLKLIAYSCSAAQTKENSKAIISFATRLEYNEVLSQIEKIKINLLLNITSKDRAILQSNRILNDIKGILDQLQTLKPVRKTFEKILEYDNKIIIVKSKIFFKYGPEGIKIGHMLLKYLDKLDLFDIIDLIQARSGKSNSKLLRKIINKTLWDPKKKGLVTDPINKVLKFNIINNNLDISISICFLKRIKDRRSKDLFKLKHKVNFDIALLDIQGKIKIIKHTHIIHTKEYLICKKRLDCTQLVIAEYITNRTAKTTNSNKKKKE